MTRSGRNGRLLAIGPFARRSLWPAAVVCWCAALVLWLLYVTGTSLPEVIAGVVAATIATIATLSAADAAGWRFRPRWRWLLDLRQLPLIVARDATLAGRVLAEAIAGRPSRGRYIAVGPLPVQAGDARTRARRAVLTIALSLSPNTIVVAFDEEDGSVLVHQLVAREPPLEVWLP
jgi:multisubunit Na+/H+ antiporter MnhE subunit